MHQLSCTNYHAPTIMHRLSCTNHTNVRAPSDSPACSMGHAECAKLLVRAGARPTDFNNRLQSSLHLAFRSTDWHQTSEHANIFGFSHGRRPPGTEAASGASAGASVTTATSPSPPRPGGRLGSRGVLKGHAGGKTAGSDEAGTTGSTSRHTASSLVGGGAIRGTGGATPTGVAVPLARVGTAKMAMGRLKRSASGGMVKTGSTGSPTASLKRSATMGVEPGAHENVFGTWPLSPSGPEGEGGMVHHEEENEGGGEGGRDREDDVPTPVVDSGKPAPPSAWGLGKLKLNVTGEQGDLVQPARKAPPTPTVLPLVPAALRRKKSSAATGVPQGGKAESTVGFPFPDTKGRDDDGDGESVRTAGSLASG